MAGTKVSKNPGSTATSVKADKLTAEEFDSFLTILLYGTAVFEKLMPKPSLDGKLVTQAKKVATYFKIPSATMNTFIHAIGDPGKNEARLEKSLDPIIDHMYDDIYPQLGKERQLPYDKLGLFNNIRVYLGTGSGAAYERMLKTSGIVGQGHPELLKAFAPETAGQDEVITKLKTFVKKHGGKGFILPADTIAELKENKPQVLAKYRVMKRELTAAYKNTLQNVVRVSGQALMNVETVKKMLQEHGVKVHAVPPGFKGKMDESGGLYTSAGLRISQHPQTAVKMNPKYIPSKDNTYVFKTVPNGTTNLTVANVYTQQWVDHNAVKKEGVFKQLKHHDFKAVEKQLQSDLSKPQIDEQGRLAAIVALSYITAMRVGTLGNKTKGKLTYGVSTLKFSHVTSSPQELVVSFDAKAGVKHTEVIKGTTPLSKDVVKFVYRMIRDTPPSQRKDHPYIFENAGRVPGNGAINNYIRSSLSLPSTIKDFRYLLGSQIAQGILQKHPFKGGTEFTQSEVEHWYKEQMKAVGKQLGHVTRGVGGQKTTSATAIKKYIAPSLQRGFFEDLQLRVPKFLGGK